MTKIALTRDPGAEDPSPFRAVAGRLQATGRTAGEAVDALAEQLPSDEAETMIIVRALRADRFFTEDQRRRLVDLMSRLRSARDAGQSLPPGEQAELERLVEAEVRAAADRAGAVRAGLFP